jgi:hypothetical protein
MGKKQTGKVNPKPVWPVETYAGTCEHIELVATVAPKSEVPIDIGRDRDDVYLGFRGNSGAYPLSLSEVRELIDALTKAHARTVAAHNTRGA